MTFLFVRTIDTLFVDVLNQVSHNRPPGPAETASPYAFDDDGTDMALAAPTRHNRRLHVVALAQ